MPKIIGIDYGAKRVGVAVTDESASVAFPRTVLTNDRTLLQAVVNLIRQENATTVVFGDSRNSEGAENPIMSDIKKFAFALQEKAAISIFYEPEFYSSSEAREHTGKSTVDAEAATIILNSFLARKKK